MEIRIWLGFILIKCIVIQYIAAKSVSLNEIIAAESQSKKQVAERPPTLIYAESRAKSASLNNINRNKQQEQQASKPSSRKILEFLKQSPLSKRLASHAKVRKFKTGNRISRDKIISPLKYRKTFQIKSPLKPKKYKIALRPRYKRKNQSAKREIRNEGLKHKYIPLLKSLSMLFDNLLNSDEGDSYEIKRKKYKRNKYYFEEQFEPSYKSSSRSDSGISKFRAQKKTITPSPSFTTEISSDAESFTSHEDNDHSTLRPYKSIPILHPRNTIGIRRVDHGSSQRSSATHNGNSEGDITGDHGDYKYYSGCGEDGSCTEGDENHTDSVTRNDSSSIRHSRTSGNGNNTRNSKVRETGVANSSSKNENKDDTIRADQFEIRRNKTESEDTIREPIRGLRGSVSENKITEDETPLSEHIWNKEVREKGNLNATHDSAGDKRITHQDGPLATEDEKIRTGNETMIVESNFPQIVNNSKTAEKKRPVLLIFDGYSVTRDKNGENKVSGKTIHIRS